MKPGARRAFALVAHDLLVTSELFANQELPLRQQGRSEWKGNQVTLPYRKENFFEKRGPIICEMTHLDLDLKTYYQETNPFHHSFLKRVVEAMQLHRYVGGKTIVDRFRLDSVFMHEATAFMSMSISNLLSFKKLMCGNYYAWAKTTLYYSNFYSINCMLRVAGFAIVHVGKPTNKSDSDRKRHERSWLSN